MLLQTGLVLLNLLRMGLVKYLDGRVFAEEARIVLNDPVGFGLVEEVDQLQELLEGELVQSRFVARKIVMGN
jgi:hypothetical protein